ncbi:uncharacterized protein LOC129714427 [Leucoraja erinacea]|uniref:uncharacterized protein LOC129714427 n=1 Tax=Leucoraja erinaceus TaxID=7782 RepID=UPI00245616DA|nr:uncharacterized protein LOC129714427 [Leucoraja erinacea]
MDRHAQEWAATKRQAWHQQLSDRHCKGRNGAAVVGAHLALRAAVSECEPPLPLGLGRRAVAVLPPPPPRARATCCSLCRARVSTTLGGGGRGLSLSLSLSRSRVAGLLLPEGPGSADPQQGPGAQQPLELAPGAAGRHPVPPLHHGADPLLVGPGLPRPQPLDGLGDPAPAFGLRHTRAPGSGPAFTGSTPRPRARFSPHGLGSSPGPRPPRSPLPGCAGAVGGAGLWLGPGGARLQETGIESVTRLRNRPFGPSCPYVQLWSPNLGVMVHQSLKVGMQVQQAVKKANGNTAQMGAATLKVRLMWDGNGLKADPMLRPLERIESWDTGKSPKCKDMGDCLGHCVLQKCACFNENCIPLLRNNLYLYGTFNGFKKLHNISQVTQDFFVRVVAFARLKQFPTQNISQPAVDRQSVQ